MWYAWWVKRFDFSWIYSSIVGCDMSRRKLRVMRISYLHIINITLMSVPYLKFNVYQTMNFNRISYQDEGYLAIMINAKSRRVHQVHFKRLFPKHVVIMSWFSRYKGLQWSAYLDACKNTKLSNAEIPRRKISIFINILRYICLYMYSH